MAWRTTQHPRTGHSVTSKSLLTVAQHRHQRVFSGGVPLWKRPRVPSCPLPRGWLKTHDTGQLFTSRMGSNQRRWSCTNNETLQECVSHIAVSVVSMPNDLPNLPNRQTALCEWRSEAPDRRESGMLQGQCAESGTNNTKYCHRDPVRRPRSGPVEPPDSGTVEQQGPRALNVLNERDPF